MSVPHYLTAQNGAETSAGEKKGFSVKSLKKTKTVQVLSKNENLKI